MSSELYYILDLNKRLKKLSESVKVQVRSVEKLEGPIGPTGAKGPQGTTGAEGARGATGTSGISGKDGKQGLEGSDGISIVDASVGIDNHLVITLSDGSEIDAGEILVTTNENTIIHSQGGGGNTADLALAVSKLLGTSMEAKRVDFDGTTLIYTGWAVAGAAEASALWRVKRATLAVDGDVTDEWADGNTEYDNVWTSRASLTYI